MTAAPSGLRLPRLTNFARRLVDAWNRLGSQTAFYVRALGFTWEAIVRYKVETLRLIANMSLGVGALVGILFAPKSGEETREFLSQKADEGRDFAQRKAKELRERADDLIERSKDAASRGKDSISAAVEGAREAYRREASKS